MSMTLPISLLIDAAVKGTFVLLAAALVTTLLRRNSAAQRYLVWQFALVAVLTLPLVKAVSPWKLPLLPQLRSPVVQPQATTPVNTAPIANVVKHERQQNTAQLQLPTSTEAKTPLFAVILYWARFAWLAIALLLRLAFGFGLVRWFAVRAYPLFEDGWLELNQELSAQMGLHTQVHLYATPHVATPMTWGFRRPVVMLPAMAEDWSMERRRIVLLHELAHIRRRDSLTHLFAQLACAVYWFHPLVWKAAARMRAEAERAADDLVLRTGTKPSVYADHLLELIRTIGGMRTPALALPMAERSTFEGRLLAILEPHINRTSPRPWSVAGMIAAVALIVLPLAGLTTASALGTKLDAQVQRVQPPSLLAKLNGADGATHKLNDSAAQPTQPAQPAATMNVAQQTQQRVASSTAITALVRAMNDGDADVRLAAVQSLGEMDGDSTAVTALSNALRSDSDARVRKMAAWALGQIESNAAVPALTYALQNDKDVDVRRTSVWALGQIEDHAAVPALVQATRDADKEIRHTAIWALGQIEDKSAVPALVQALKSDDQDVRKQAVWALGQIESDDAVDALAAMRGDADPEVRSEVAWALGQIEDKSALPALSAMLKEDKVPEVRAKAAWALGQIEANPAPQALVDALKDPDSEVRATAAWALSQTEDPATVGALRAALKDSDTQVRQQVLHALMQMGDEIGAEVLADMLKDPDPEVRRAAAAALGHRGNDPDPRPEPQPRPRPRPIN